MIGIYFSGTGNSRYALEVFLSKYDEKPEYGTGCGEGGGQMYHVLSLYKHLPETGNHIVRKKCGRAGND